MCTRVEGEMRLVQVYGSTRGITYYIIRIHTNAVGHTNHRFINNIITRRGVGVLFGIIGIIGIGRCRGELAANAAPQHDINRDSRYILLYTWSASRSRNRRNVSTVSRFLASRYLYLPRYTYYARTRIPHVALYK